MIAVMNQVNFLGIMLSSVVYWIFDRIAVTIDWSPAGDYQVRCPIFAMTALIMLPALLFYRPQSDPQLRTPDGGGVADSHVTSSSSRSNR